MHARKLARGRLHRADKRIATHYRVPMAAYGPEPDATLRVIFLDVDGVLNSTAHYERMHAAGKMDEPPHRWFHEFDPAAVKLLGGLVERTGAHLVLSSTWRLARGIGRVKEILAHHGFRYCDRFIGETPRMPRPIDAGAEYGERGREIRAWLDLAPLFYRDAGPFVILDDDADMGELMPRLVQTKWADGLTAEDCERAAAMLAEVPDGV